MLADLGDADFISLALQDWADRELAFWRRRGLRRIEVERQLHAISEQRPAMRLFNFAEGRVHVQPTRHDNWANDNRRTRIGQYLRFFEDAAALLPLTLSTTLCVDLDDRVIGHFDVPVFTFQRMVKERSLLIPDIDLLVDDFHRDAKYQDETPYDAKLIRAVFAGATTGGMMNEDRARRLGTPRLQAAQFFQDRMDVDFRLPHIVQCLDEGAQAFLEAQIYCQRPALSWAEQFQSRFLISVDGNGATCARVAVGLASNSVLLKYESEHLLYYFPALRPHEHYVPIAQDAEVLDVLATERAEPGHYAAIPAAARRFVAEYLNRERATEYMARLVLGYEAALVGEAPSVAPVQRVAAAGRIADGSVSVNENGAWAGVPGSGTPLTAFKLLIQPRSLHPRLQYQGLLEGGRFTPTRVEGTWCGGDADGGALVGIRLEHPRGAVAPELAIEACFSDGSRVKNAAMGVACRAENGASLEAFRVILS